MKLVILFCAFLTFSTCKNTTQTESEKINDYLIIDIKAKVLEDDIFEIYYSEDPKDLYLPENKVRANVKGGANFQNINFKFPDRTYPMKFRIDIGLNRNETIIEILEIKLSTGKNSKTFSGSEIGKNFRTNQFIQYNPSSNSFNRHILNGAYDPFLLSLDLSDDIVNLFSD